MIRRQNARLVFAAISLASVSFFPALAQSAEGAARFGLADVHPSPHSTSSDSRDVSGGLTADGRYHLRHATMLDLVSTAYGVVPEKVLGGPSWLQMDRFDIRATVPAGASAATVKPMLRALLAERFALVAHNDTKPIPAWVLTAGKHPLLEQSDGSGESRCRSGGSGDLVEVTCHNMTMAELVSSMGSMDGAWYYINDTLVADQTGLDGAWDFELKYSRRWNTKVAGTEIVSLFDALDRIGLKLDPSMVPVPVVVVDSVNRVPTPNSPEAEKAIPPAPTEFEVADVKPTDPAYLGDDFRVEKGGRVIVRGKTLQSLIADAWDITEEMIVGAPKFLDSDRWDIVAKASGAIVNDGDADIDALRAMFRTMLTKRFRLTAHYEDWPMPAYTLIAVKPKLKQADPASRSGCREGPPTLVKVEPRSTNPVLGRLLTCTNVSMAWFAQELQYLASGYIHSEVLDATGLEGGWDFTLSFSKAAQYRGITDSERGLSSAVDPNGAISAPEALEKQLGLKLELRKRPVHVLVIDHVEEKPTDN